jgi:hypothetical protein
MKTLMLAMFVLLLTFSTSVKSEQIATIKAPGIVVALFKDPCRLKNKITNLPLRATWTSRGKTLEGCFGTFDESNMIGAYFEDLTMIVIPMAAAQPATEI